MAFPLRSLGDLNASRFDAIIDVRSPAEFGADHIPGAINLPVLSDAERARVGTIYVQESPFLARKIGAALVARNAARHIETRLTDYDGGWQPLVYCWRGGQRSGSFASILAQIGWRVETLDGGYQSYRRLVVNRLYEQRFPVPVVLLDGNTGTAKTDILARLPQHGVQVIDLEGLANHRGSALGNFGAQPAQKGFETALAAEIEKLDHSKRLVLEAESSKIGSLTLPPSLFAAMKIAPRIEIEASVAARAKYLTRAYADLVSDTTTLIERLEKLVRLQGREKVASWKEMAISGNHEALAADLIRQHYDPRYLESRGRKRTSERNIVKADTLDERDIDRIASEVAARLSALAVEPVAS